MEEFMEFITLHEENCVKKSTCDLCHVKLIVDNGMILQCDFCGGVTIEPNPTSIYCKCGTSTKYPCFDPKTDEICNHPLIYYDEDLDEHYYYDDCCSIYTKAIK